MTGTRFLDSVDLLDSIDSDSYYTPRHVRAVALSPDLQRALDAAFSPEPEPDFRRAVEPAPARMVWPEHELDEQQPSWEPEPVAPARAHLALVIPETITVTPLPRSADRPASVHAELDLATPEPLTLVTMPVPEPEPLTLVTMPVPEPVPALPAIGAGFPDPSTYAARWKADAPAAAPLPSPRLRMGRRVEPSRLIPYSRVALG